MLSEMFQLFCPNPGQAFDLIKDHDSDGQSRQWLLLGRKVCLKAWKRLRGVGPSLLTAVFGKETFTKSKLPFSIVTTFWSTNHLTKPSFARLASC